jgi:hypothetical protein
MTDVMDAWFAARTAGAPPRLLAASEAWWQAATGDTPGVRLADAGRRALDAAIAAGASRDAALDLLAADALITLALLAESESEPLALGARALAIRDAVTPS